jgi:hypothetical protein
MEEGFVAEVIQILVENQQVFTMTHAMKAWKASAHYRHINGISSSSSSEDEA